jgi:hypothetical protein
MQLPHEDYKKIGLGWIEAESHDARILPVWVGLKLGSDWGRGMTPLSRGSTPSAPTRCSGPEAGLRSGEIPKFSSTTCS